jgi:methionyl-tRNA synthetase
VAEKRAQIRKLWEMLDISYSHFVYTDRPEHTVSVQRMLRLAQQREPGVIYKARYQGRYCVYDERYISDGTEPVNCDICGRPGELISEENYFFKLSAFEKRLLDLYEHNPQFVQPGFRRNEVISFVKSGLRDISVSRKRIKWGVPWPDDPEQVFYVWYDALTGYLTGIGFGEGENGGAEFHKYWPADIHMVGKDIIRFHAIYWPAFLMAAGLPLPKSIVAHGWLLVGQDKMSKSKGNAVYVEPVVKLFDSETNGLVSGSDVLRYYVLRDIPFGLDGSISYEGLIQRYNSDLANDLGNLANRTVSMLNGYFDGKLLSTGDFEKEQHYAEREIAELAAKTLNQYRARFDACDFSRGLDAAWQFISRVNKYLVETEPWALASNLEANRTKLADILYTAAEAVRFASVLLYPITPRSARRLWEQLGCEGGIEDQRFDDLKWGGLRPGSKVGKVEIIFPRLEKDKAVDKLLELDKAEQGLTGTGKEVSKRVESQSEEKTSAPAPRGAPDSSPAPAGRSRARPSLPTAPRAEESRTHSSSIDSPAPSASAQPSGAPPTEPKISIDDFAKVDMRVGEILSAEPLPGAKRLLKLQVDIGTEVRQVCAGIAEHYRPEELLGMKVVLVVNLQPRKLRGIESNGMIVAASVGEGGKPVLATFKEDVPKGARLK